MSDQSKPLPIRTDQDPHDKTQVKIVDAVDPTRQAEVTPNREVRVLDLEANAKMLFGLLANSNFLKLINFDKIVPSYVGNLATLVYTYGGNQVAEARFRFVDALDWDLEVEAYINNDGAGLLLDDDGSNMILD